MTKKFMIEPDNEFHEGWLSFLFGFDRPTEGEALQEGWDMASETDSVRVVRIVFKPRRSEGIHFVVVETAP